MTNKRPNESDYASHVAYTRNLEEYCEWLENDKPFSPDWVNYRQGKMDAAAELWVGLTEGERNKIEDECEMMIGKPAFDSIEAKLKEKNL